MGSLGDALREAVKELDGSAFRHLQVTYSHTTMADDWEDTMDNDEYNNEGLQTRSINDLLAGESWVSLL
jgi:hypothetical protein